MVTDWLKAGLIYLNTWISGAEQALEPVPVPDKVPAYDVISVTNSDNETSQIAIFTNESIDAFRKEVPEPSRLSQFIYGYNYDLEISLGQSLSAYFSEEAAAEIAYITSSSYTEEAGYIPNSEYPIAANQTLWNILLDENNAFGPMAVPFQKDMTQNINGRPAPYCGIFHLSETATGEKRIKSFLQLTDTDISVTVPEEYGPEFRAFVKYHEIAHCMGGDERTSDFVASKMLLANYADTAKALRFLDVLEDIRALNSLEDQTGAYMGTSESIRKAMDDFKKAGRITETNEEIWFWAKVSKSRSTGPMSDLAETLNNDPEIQTMFANMDYAAIGDHILKLQKTTDEEYQALYGRLADSMHSMANIVPKLDVATSPPAPSP